MGAAAKADLPRPPRHGRKLLDPRSRLGREQLHGVVKSLLTEEGNQDPDWKDIRARMILSSCAYMAQELLRGPPEAPYNGRFLIGPHHLEWDKLVAQNKRVCVLSPRDSGKSFFFNLAYPIWKVITTPGGSGFIFSATKQQAQIILDIIKVEIENNPKLQWLLPQGSKRVWSATHIKLSNGHHIYARGYGTRVRGGHPNWIVVDDGINDDSGFSETVRRKAVDYFYSAITNMIVPGGQIIVVGTPFHTSDLYGDLSRNKEYVYRRYKAINDDGTALWEVRYPISRLLARKREIGPIRFAREFQCEPIADEMSLFPYRLFKGEPAEAMAVRLGMSAEYWEERGVTRYIGVDFAISSNVSADYTVIFVVGVDKHGNRWIIEIFRAKGLSYQAQLSTINRLGRLYDPAAVMLEANQMQTIFGNELQRTTDLPIYKHTTGAEKHALDKGVPSLRVLLENGKVRIPRGDKRSVRRTDTFIDEMRNFTFLKGKVASVGAHDDTVMAFWLANLAIKRGGVTFTFGDDVDLDEDEEDEEADNEADEELDAFGNPLPRSA